MKYLTREQAENEIQAVLEQYEDDWDSVEQALIDVCDLKNPRIKALADELKDHFDAQMYRKIREIMNRVKPEE